MDHGALPATLNYRGYTKSSCTSINHVVCHGIPDDKPLRDGDIVNIDVTFILDGWHGDSSRMYPVGEIKRAAERLLEVTYECLMRGIAAVKPGRAHRRHRRGDPVLCRSASAARWCAISAATASAACSTTRRTSCTTATPSEGVEMRPGMIFTIEPMINLGRPHVKVLSDGWTAVTRDRSLSAQYEHTVGVTETGCEIFTLSPGGLDRPGLPVYGRPAILRRLWSGRRAWRRRRRTSEASSPRRRCRAPLEPAAAKPQPHYHRPSRAAARALRRAGADALADYELLELLLFRLDPARATPSRSPRR